MGTTPIGMCELEELYTVLDRLAALKGGALGGEWPASPLFRSVCALRYYDSISISQKHQIHEVNKSRLLRFE